LTKDADQIPFEIIDVLKRENRIDIRNIIDITPAPQIQNDIVFVDVKDDIYYSFKSQALEEKVSFLLDSCIKNLYYISQNINNLISAWSGYIEGFDHEVFWDYLLCERTIKLLANKEFDEAMLTLSKEQKNDSMPRLKNKSKTEIKIKVAEIISADRNYNQYIPDSFDPIKYLRLNPDVEAAGIDPYQHWLLFGQHENRPF
jgi:hypothetical protein